MVIWRLFQWRSAIISNKGFCCGEEAAKWNYRFVERTVQCDYRRLALIMIESDLSFQIWLMLADCGFPLISTTHSVDSSLHLTSHRLHIVGLDWLIEFRFKMSLSCGLGRDPRYRQDNSIGYLYSHVTWGQFPHVNSIWETAPWGQFPHVPFHSFYVLNPCGNLSCGDSFHVLNPHRKLSPGDGFNMLNPYGKLSRWDSLTLWKSFPGPVLTCCDPMGKWGVILWENEV